MYLILTEDSLIWKSDEITDDDKTACDDGHIDIINTEDLTRYYAGTWHEINYME